MNPLKAQQADLNRILMGLAGLCLLPQRRANLIHIFPLIALGLAAFVDWALPRLLADLGNLFDRVRRRLPFLSKNTALDHGWQVSQSIIIGGLVFMLIISPVVWMVFADVVQSVYVILDPLARKFAILVIPGMGELIKQVEQVRP